MIRLGLCCIFAEQPIKFRTTTARYLGRIQQPYEYLFEIISHNLDSLYQALEYCFQEGVGSFRINSQFFPLCSHPDWVYRIDDLPHADKLLEQVERCRSFKKNQDVRLTLHPDQFVVLNSPKPEVVQSAKEELEYHAHLADLLGVDVINIHGGGVYGDKKGALERLVTHYRSLSPSVKSRLTLENDDKSYTPEDLLPICEGDGIPFVYDVHHHRCLKDTLTVLEATNRALKTWGREPLFHLSSPLEGWEGRAPHRHHDYIDARDFPEEWLSLRQNITVEVEAKAKELAIDKLKQDLREL